MSSATKNETNSTTVQPALPQFELIKLVIDIRWRRPNLIPGPVVANVLRGALAITFRRLVCPDEFFDHDCPPCPLYASCAYGQVFSPTPPAGAAQLSRQADLPRPFVIEPPGLQPDARPTPEGMRFGLMLFGSAIDRLPFFITTLARLGAEGMGRDRVPFSIEKIAALHPAGDETLFAAGAAELRLPRRRVTTQDILLGAPRPTELGTAPATGRPRVTLRFLTPLLLKTGSGLDARSRHVPAREIRDRPPFGVIARRARDRISALSAFFAEPWQRTDFAEFGHRADAVQLVESRTVWLSRQRRSTKTGQSHELSGLVGTATYEFPTLEALEEFWPVLVTSEYLHIGKFAPWGNGGVRVLSRR